MREVHGSEPASSSGLGMVLLFELVFDKKLEGVVNDTIRADGCAKRASTWGSGVEEPGLLRRDSMESESRKGRVTDLLKIGVAKLDGPAGASAIVQVSVKLICFNAS
jgi:hypothetical protein